MKNDSVSENCSQEKILSSGIQLRTSARVLKKQKLDLEASLAAESKKDEKSEVESLSSSQSQTTPALVSVSNEKKDTSKRVRGTITLWSPEDKSAFFEALNDAGKDLDGIEKIMRNKARKRPGECNGPCVTSKTRLQVRSFYHRTLLKIFKHVQLPDIVKKSTQELYILINYGELRKRVGLINERNAVKLKELIYCGSTQVKMKGKTWRVKTPVCRALKRLNKLEESMDELRVPLRVEILLTPRENKDRCRVENLGYNARIKTILSLETPISHLISFLQSRWITKEMNDEEKSLRNNLQDKIPDPGGGIKSNTDNESSTHVLLNTTPTSKLLTNINIVPSKCFDSLPDLSDCLSTPSESVNKNVETPIKTSDTNLVVNDQNVTPCKINVDSKNSSVNSSSHLSSSPSVGVNNNYKIRIAPKQNAILVKPNLKCGQLVTSSCISLMSHQLRIGQPLPSLQALIGLAPPPGIKAGKSWARWHKEGEQVDEMFNTEVTDPVVMSACTNTPVSSSSADLLSSVLPSFTNQLAAANSSSPAPQSPEKSLNKNPKVSPKSNENDHKPKVVTKSNETEQSVVQEAVNKEETKDDFERRVRKGWTLDNTARLRVADLYLMFGSNGRLEIDYWFDGLSEDDNSDESPSLVRLLSLAKMWYSGIPHSTKECWACGHKPPIINNSSQSCSNLIIQDPKVEVKTEVVETPTNTTAAVVVVSPAPTTTGRFRQPLLPAPSSTRRLLTSTDETYKSLQIKPKYSNRRGRYRPKNVVVQRMLPLLPKTSSSSQSCTVVTLQVLAGGPAGSSTGEFIKTKSIKDSSDLKPIAPKPSSSVNEKPIKAVSAENEEVKDKLNNETVKTDPFNFLSSCLYKENKQINKSEDLPTSTSHSNFSGLLGAASDKSDIDMLSTPPTSPSRILKEGESQWLNSEVSDFSLSSFLGHLESPLKTNVMLDDTRMSADVDSQLQSLMTETSLDYTAKFADLAAKIAGPGNSNGSSSTTPS